MNHNGRHLSNNNRIREKIAEKLPEIPVGIEFHIGKLAGKIGDIRKREITPKVLGGFLKERDDVEHIKPGIWRRVTA